MYLLSFAIILLVFLVVSAELADDHDSGASRMGRSARIVDANSFVRSGFKSSQFQSMDNIGKYQKAIPPPNALFKVLLKNYSDAKCNDGSPAGYYIRKSPYGSQTWFIYLEGGWFCFDSTSCEWRLHNYNQYMSSKQWQSYRSGMGILSGDPDENPLFYVHNFVIVQYCSSDLWAGTHKSHDGGFSFLGSRIIDAVVTDLLRHEKLGEADVVYLAGSSAGGLGVLLNIDRIAGVLNTYGVATRGIVDSAWFLDVVPSKSMLNDQMPCTSSSSYGCNHNLRDYMKIGLKLWHHRLPSSCQISFSEEDSWKCLFANNTIHFVSTPVMVIQFLYDEVQSLLSQMARPSTLEEWRKVVWLGSQVRRSLRALRYVFAPACYSHSALIQPGWVGLASSATYRSMGEVVECWMYKLDRSLTRKKGRLIITRSPLPPSTRYQSNRLTNRCRSRALDGCDDPLCNRSCPKVTDPGTGDELNLFDSIMQSDMSAVMQAAHILDLDPARLSRQDRGLVLRMLVRRSSLTDSDFS